MLKRRFLHWLVVFTAFLMLLFGVQFLMHLWSQVHAIENNAKIHFLVNQAEAPGFEQWRNSLDVQKWSYYSLESWSANFPSFWTKVLDTEMSPVDLFGDVASGVWVGKLNPATTKTLFRGRPELKQEILVGHQNVINVLGYPSWSDALYKWFWTWSVISFAIILIASVMLMSSGISDLSLRLVDQKEELEIKHWLGATSDQLRRPYLTQTLLRTTLMIVLAVALNVAAYIILVNQEVLHVSWSWIKAFSIVSLSAIAIGVTLVWVASRITFKRIFDQWVY